MSVTAAPTDHTSGFDAAQRLAFELRDAIDGEVRFDPGSRHLYATDSSNFRHVPVGVVVPRTVDDVVAVHTICRRYGAAITSRGGGTSLAGQACNAAVIIDHSKYLTAIEDIDVEGRTATVQPGLVLDTLGAAVAEHGLTWGPKPSTHNRCTIGGMVGNNACGTEAFRFGRVEDNVEALEILCYDGTRMWVGAVDDDELADIASAGGRRGEIHAALRGLRDRHADAIRSRFPDIPRRVSGFNLTELVRDDGMQLARALVGTEGTCVTVLRARLKLNPTAPERVLVVLGYPDVYTAADAVAEIRHAEGLYALEGLDEHLIDNIRDKGLHADAVPYLPEGDGWLLCEFGGQTKDEARDNARALLDRVALDGDGPSTHLYDEDGDIAAVWQAREAGLGVTAHFEGDDHWPGWEDSAVHPDRVGAYLRDLRSLFDDYGYDAAVYGHFGDGCVHCRIDFTLTTADGVADYMRFLDDAADLVSRYDGSYSGEHGDGQQRGALLDKMFGPEIVAAFREFKAIWDPDGRMNPGKVVDAYAPDENLRLGADHRQWRPDVVFGYPDDDGDFNRAQLRCVGVGKCRRDDGSGTMCPSYMVTHDEQHSTRGRARLLFEMLQPDTDLDGWRDDSIREALDLCLSCKGCVADCPVNVDIPTYKAEFLHHHYAGRIHPRAHYALGLIDKWSVLASRMPGLANLALAAPGVGWVLKKAAGVATQRPAPVYAEQTFREWFAGHQAATDGRVGGAARRGDVILFPDTFVDNFHPEVGKATVAVLEDAGYRVQIPSRRICCGRPLYDYGFLDLARCYLDGLLEEFRDDIAAGTKIVGMEPSCVAVFRDELVAMLPHDADAKRLAGATRMLGEFLVDVGYDFPTLDRTALVHGHCHHKGALGMAGENAALDALGLDWRELDAGCCGLAGSFGFEAGEKFEVSVAAGERKLLPAVRDAPSDTLLIADGFSCRTQIDQLQQLDGGPGRRALHLAQVIEMARASGPSGPSGPDPVEEGWVGDASGEATGLTRKDLGVLVAIGTAVGAAGLARSRRSR
jgi:FAD/FMN-containing dehydrogenase/Fe-S oxidoreductase